MELEKMMALQENLIGMYVKIGSLPEKIDINQKSGQKLLRDLGFAFIVELCEAFECLLALLESAETNGKIDLVETLDQFNEELADAWHFLLELNYYAGFTGPLMVNYIRMLAHDVSPQDAPQLSPGASLYSVASLLNQQDRNLSYVYVSYRMAGKSMMEEKGLPKLHISTDYLEIHQAFHHNIIAKYCLALNELKIKDWSQSARESNFNNFYTKLSDSFLMVVRYMAYMGKTFPKILEIYEKASQKNVDRIKAKY